MGYKPSDPARAMQDALAELLDVTVPLPQDLRAAALLRAAAELIETAAYELAGSESASRVARLILTSAEVARLADAVGGEPAFRRAC